MGLHHSLKKIVHFCARDFYSFVMIIWTLALVLIALLAIFGWTFGAIRMAVATLGLLVGALVAWPTAAWLYPLFELGGVRNPLAAWMISPLLTFVAVVFIFNVIGLGLSHKVDAFFKYKVPEIKLALFERMNTRLGLCLALVNAAIYFLLICMLVYLYSYPAHQFSSGSKDTFFYRLLVDAGKELETSKLNRVLAPFDPLSKKFYLITDTLGLLYRNPALYARAERYPALTPLVRQPQFQTLLRDAEAVDLFKKMAPIQTIMNQPSVNAIITNSALVGALFKLDLKDFTNYLHTGKTDKFADERILGQWTFELRTTLNQVRRGKPNMNNVERFRLEKSYTTNITSAALEAQLDNYIVFTLVPPNNQTQTVTGTWKSAGGTRYEVNWNGGSGLEKEMEVEADRITLKRDNKLMIFGPQ